MLKQYTGFDHENVLKPGTPIRVTKTTTSLDDEYTLYALIQYSSSSKLQLIQATTSPLTIMIDEVVSGKYKIEPLVFEEVK